MSPAALCESITIQPGSCRDFDALATLHYKGGAPATIARRPDGSACILAARDAEARLAGVLVVSMPTLNSASRRMAWPGVYDTGNKRRDAIEVNRSLRCISRVIVEPRFRAVGVARRMVRTYLDEPLTPRTEAVASMGRVCPFFEAAGMTAYDLAPSRRDARLLDALASAAIEPWELLERTAAEASLRRHPWLAREARLWADGSASTRRFIDTPPERLLMFAASRASHTPIAYAHGG